MSTLGTEPLLSEPGSEMLSLRRAAAPVLNQYGGHDPATPAVSSIGPCMVHRLSGRDLEKLPEADRHRETIQVYSPVQLFAEGGTVDRIDYGGRSYRVTHCEDASRHGGVFIAFAQLEDAVPA